LWVAMQVAYPSTSQMCEWCMEKVMQWWRTLGNMGIPQWI